MYLQQQQVPFYGHYTCAVSQHLQSELEDFVGAAYYVYLLVCYKTTTVDFLTRSDLLYAFVLRCQTRMFLQCFDAVGWAAGRASGL